MNIALVGYGKFGKKYFNTLKNLDIFENILIYRKRKKKNFKILTKSSLTSNKIDLGIIVTPVDTHFKIASMFLNSKIPIVLEKPVSNKINEIQELNKISKKNKTSVIVNYSDLYNQNFIDIKKEAKKEKIKKLNIHFKTKNKYYYKKSSPILDWLPHFFAIYFNFFKNFDKFTIKKFKEKISKKHIFQSIIINLFIKNKNISNFYFNNNLNQKIRKFKLSCSNNQYLYNGYSKRINTKTPMEKIIFKLHQSKLKKKYINDLPISLKIQKAINKLI